MLYKSAIKIPSKMTSAEICKASFNKNAPVIARAQMMLQFRLSIYVNDFMVIRSIYQNYLLLSESYRHIQ